MRPRKKRWVPPPSTSFLHRGDFESVQLHSLDPSISELFSRVYESPPPDVEVFTSQTLAEIRIHRDEASKGHAESARRLHEIAVSSIRALEWVAIEKPDLLHPLASTNTTWPVLFSHSPIVQASIAKRLESIGFATKLGSSWIDALEVVKNLSPANAKNAKNIALLLINSIQSVRIAHSFATESTADQMLSLQGLPGVTENFRDELYDFHFRSAIGRFYANRLTIMPRHTLDLLQKCTRLPDFSSEKSVVIRWWDVGYELLMLNTNGHPEAVAYLYALGRSREKHYSGLKVTTKGDEYKPRAVKANVRSKILTDLREEFDRLAKQLEKTTPERSGVGEDVGS